MKSRKSYPRTLSCRTSRTGRTNGETVSHNGFSGFTQRVLRFHTTDFIISHNGFHGNPLRFYSLPVAELLITSCGFTHNRLRI